MDAPAVCADETVPSIFLSTLKREFAASTFRTRTLSEPNSRTSFSRTESSPLLMMPPLTEKYVTIPVALESPTALARLKNPVDTPMLYEPLIALTDVLNPEIETKLKFVRLCGVGAIAMNLPSESIGAISSSVTVEDATLILLITLPWTSDTFALADVAPGSSSNTILSPT